VVFGLVCWWVTFCSFVGGRGRGEGERGGGEEDGLLLTGVLQGWEGLSRRVDETLHVGSSELERPGILIWKW